MCSNSRCKCFSLISSYLKRERTAEVQDEKVDVVVSPKKKRKISRGRSRKRPKNKIQRESSGPKAKKARKVESPPKSPEIDENVDLQPVSINLSIVGYFFFLLHIFG